MSWSCEYNFTELAIEVNGIECGQFAGVAILEHDEGYEGFYVRSITLDGEKVTKFRTTLGNLKTLRKPFTVSLKSPHYGRADTHSQHLYAALEKALYASDEADQFFHAERTQEFA